MLKLKIDREFVISELTQLDRDEDRIEKIDYESMSDGTLIENFCLSGLFAQYLNGDGIAEESLVGLY